MNRRWSRKIQIAVLASLTGLGAGCTTTPEVQSMRAEIEEAKQAAAEAQSRADKAQATADEALRAARGAAECCEDTNEKIDRMFKRSMYK